MTCYTFSVRTTISEFKSVKVEMKRFDEEENEDFCEEEYFAVDGVSFTKLKIDFRKVL